MDLTAGAAAIVDRRPGGGGARRGTRSHQPGDRRSGAPLRSAELRCRRGSRRGQDGISGVARGAGASSGTHSDALRSDANAQVRSRAAGFAGTGKTAVDVGVDHARHRSIEF